MAGLPALSRRRFLGTGSAAAVAMAAPYVKTARSAGRLELGVQDHWVPGVNPVVERICTEWGQQNNVEVKVDFITSVGNKLALTAQAEARAGTGHDIFQMGLWGPSIQRTKLEPLDDVIADVEADVGPMDPAAKYCFFIDGAWRSSPVAVMGQTHAFNSRIDHFRDIAGIDLPDIFPAGPRDPAKVATWTYDTLLTAAQKLHAAGFGFGAPLSPTPDGTFWLAPLFAAFGAVLVDADRQITVNSDETRAVLGYMKELSQFMSDSVYAWDDASNNRWMLSGRGSAVINPPSPWAVAKRDAPELAPLIWHHDLPVGPRGRFRHLIPNGWGIWHFSPNKEAAKDLLRHMATREVAEQLVTASKGYEAIIFDSFRDFGVVEEAGPPAGTLYNYAPRGDEQLILCGTPAPNDVAAQIFTQGVFGNLVARVTSHNEALDDAIAWAENELEGFLRG